MTDGADKYPIYSVLPSSTLLYTMQKLIATNSHRVFVTEESQTHSPSLSPSPSAGLCGIVSIVDGTLLRFQSGPYVTSTHSHPPPSPLPLRPHSQHPRHRPRPHATPPPRLLHLLPLIQFRIRRAVPRSESSFWVPEVEVEQSDGFAEVVSEE